MTRSDILKNIYLIACSVLAIFSFVYAGKKPVAPTITNIQITGISEQSATISWLTDIPAVSSIQYGTSRNYKILHFNGEEVTPLIGAGHMVATGISYCPPNFNTKECIDDIALEQKALCFAAHPSATQFGDWFSLWDSSAIDNLIGMEVRSDGDAKLSEAEWWDKMLTKGRKFWAFATTDGHTAPTDRGFVVVNAPELTEKAIIDNIKKGNFYAIRKISRNALRVAVTDQGKTINAVSDSSATFEFIGSPGYKSNLLKKEENVLSSRYQLTGKEGYVRVKVTTDSGVAYSQPIFIKENGNSFTIDNPYQTTYPNYYKGQLHCHTNNSDGGMGPPNSEDEHYAIGYDFIAESDHNIMTLDPESTTVKVLSDNKLRKKHLMIIPAFGPGGCNYFTINNTGKSGLKAHPIDSVFWTKTSNLALGKPTFSSSDEAPYVASAKVNDGDMNTRWSSLFKDSEWVAIDLGTPQVIKKVVLTWEISYATDYDLQVSDDSLTWKPVYTNNSCKGRTNTVLIKPVRTRFVRMYSNKRSSEWGNSLWEFEVY
jgi:hypothetical protein